MNNNDRTTVEIYSNLSSKYGSLTEQRRSYLQAVDRHFLELAKSCGKNWLDIGSGDGIRAVLLNQFLGKTLTLIEPSRLLAPSFEELNPEVSVIRSTLSSAKISRQFDLISMLWNVVGHLGSLDDSLRIVHKILADDGVLFLDANSPFNVRRFGLQAVVRNMTRRGQIQFPWPDSNSLGQVNFFGRRVLSKKLKLAGFAPDFHYVQYDNGLPALSQYTGSIICIARKRRR